MATPRARPRSRATRGSTAASTSPWSLVVAACALACAPTPVLGAASGEAAQDTLTRTQFSTAAVVVTAGLILFSIGFEKAEHFMLHKPSKVTRPVVRAMFQELTGLGFLGVVLFVVESTPALSHLSKAIFGYGRESAVASVIHTVHMALFLVLCIFLVNVLLLMLMAMRQQKTWAARELACVDRKQLVHGYSSFISGPRRANACVRFYRWVCSQHDEAYERVVYNALRARFIQPHAAAKKKDPGPILATDGSMILTLNENNAHVYRKKLMVFAFQSRDPCRFDKHWGTSNGASGDYVIVGVDGDLYSCGRQLFEETYEPIAGEPHKYRKTGFAYGRLMNHDFKVKTSEGLQRGGAGHYLVQDAKTGQQYSVTSVEFERLYERVNKNSLHRNRSDLPQDFDFGQYLTHVLGKTLGQIVTLEWHTWLIILANVFVLWLGLLFEHTAPFFVMNHGMGIAWAVANLVFMRKMYTIRDALTPRKLLHSKSLATVRPKPRHSKAQKAQRAKPPPITVDEDNEGESKRLDAKRLDAKRVWQSTGAMEAAAKDTPDGAGAGADVEAGGASAKLTPIPAGVPVMTKSMQEMPAGLNLGAGMPKPSDRRLDMMSSSLTVGTPMNSIRYENADGHSVLVHNDVLVGRGDQNTPVYLDQPLATKAGMCAKRPPNRHEQLFWFGHRGPGAVKEFVRANILFMSMFLAVNCMILSSIECGWENGCPARSLLIFVPQIMNVILLPRLITAYVLVANVEKLRKNKVVQDIVRHQRTEKAMRALRLLSALRSYARKVERRNSTAPIFNNEGSIREAQLRTRANIKGAAKRVYGIGTAVYLRRRHEFKEAFAIFDRESTGHVRRENIQSLFELLGLGEIAAKAAENIVAELDVDGQGSVEFEEFFDWTAAQHEDVNVEDVARDIFNIIDRDHSHDITATELRDTLASLGAVMTPEDIMRTVADADHDGSGTITFHEFVALMRKHIKADME